MVRMVSDRFVILVHLERMTHGGADHQYRTAIGMAERLGLSELKVYRMLTDLRKEGLVSSEKQQPIGKLTTSSSHRPRIYSITPEGQTTLDELREVLGVKNGRP